MKNIIIILLATQVVVGGLLAQGFLNVHKERQQEIRELEEMIAEVF